MSTNSPEHLSFCGKDVLAAAVVVSVFMVVLSLVPVMSTFGHLLRYEFKLVSCVAYVVIALENLYKSSGNTRCASHVR